MKKKNESVELEALMEDVLVSSTEQRAFCKKKLALGVTALCVVTSLCAVGYVAYDRINSISLGDEAVVQLSPSPLAATTTKKSTITIPAGTVKANPFLPYRDIGSSNVSVNDVPAYTLVEPPEIVNENSDAARVMDTIVSGILFDKYSPSAILNIEGNDYLVKKGDVVNNYKVLNIAQDSVTVQLGENTYKAGIGEILTEGTLKHNDVSNLSNKFGGVK